MLSTDQPASQNLPIPEAVYAPVTAVPNNKELEPEQITEIQPEQETEIQNGLIILETTSMQDVPSDPEISEIEKPEPVVMNISNISNFDSVIEHQLDREQYLYIAIEGISNMVQMLVDKQVDQNSIIKDNETKLDKIIHNQEMIISRLKSIEDGISNWQPILNVSKEMIQEVNMDIIDVQNGITVSPSNEIIPVDLESNQSSTCTSELSKLIAHQTRENPDLTTEDSVSASEYTQVSAKSASPHESDESSRSSSNQYGQFVIQPVQTPNSMEEIQPMHKVSSSTFWNLPLNALIGNKPEDFVGNLSRFSTLPVTNPPEAFAVKEQDIIVARTLASTSRHKFAVNLFRAIITIGEVYKKNVTGKTFRGIGKMKINPYKMEIIQRMTFSYYPTSITEENKEWRYIVRQLNKAVWYAEKYIKDHLDITEIL